MKAFMRASHLATLLLPLFAAGAMAADSLLTLKIIAKDGRFTPDKLTGPAGQRIKIEISNQGKSPVEFENLQLRVERVLGPDASSFVVLNALKPGSYTFVDEFHPQTGKLELTVK